MKKLELSERARDEADVALRSMENSEQTNFDKLDMQEHALKTAQISANESDRRYEGMSRELAIKLEFVRMREKTQCARE